MQEFNCNYYKQNKLQAVLITDSYNDDLSPPYSVPCLLPMLNTPLLCHTLDCLYSALVQEVIIFCSSHADILEKYLKSTKYWKKISLKVIVSECCRNLGDAMRDLHVRNILRDDFILLTGYLVGNLKLLPALKRHKQIRNKDRGIAMTQLFKNVGDRTRAVDDELTIVFSDKTKRLIIYQRDFKKIKIPIRNLMEAKKISVNRDLCDTRVAVCSTTVLSLFTDNFDYETMDDFVNGLLKEQEIEEGSVYTYILPSETYAASVTSWQNYHTISHDIVHRWVYPNNPDLSVKFVKKHFFCLFDYVYIEKDVKVEERSILERDVVVSKGSYIAVDTDIKSTFIGNNCKISENSCIKNSHLFNKVTIEKGCTIDYCVVGEGCIIRSGAKLTSCIIGPNVVIGKDKIVENMRLQSEKPLREEGKENFGPKAFKYQTYEESDDDSDSESDDFPIIKKFYGLKIETNLDVESTESEDEDSDSEHVVQEDVKIFFGEVVETLLRGYKDKVPCENLILEINSSRYAYNIALNEVNYFVIHAILTLQDEYQWKNILLKLNYFYPIISNYIRNEEAMFDALISVEDIAEGNIEFQAYYVKLLHLWYDKNILSEEAILKWYKEPRTDESEVVENIRHIVQPLIDWLEGESESESGSGSD